MSDKPRKGSKVETRLATRVKDYERMGTKSGYRKPGSNKK